MVRCNLISLFNFSIPAVLNVFISDREHYSTPAFCAHEFRKTSGARQTAAVKYLEEDFSQVVAGACICCTDSEIMPCKGILRNRVTEGVTSHQWRTNKWPYVPELLLCFISVSISESWLLPHLPIPIWNNSNNNMRLQSLFPLNSFRPCASILILLMKAIIDSFSSEVWLLHRILRRIYTVLFILFRFTGSHFRSFPCHHISCCILFGTPLLLVAVGNGNIHTSAGWEIQSP